PQERRGVGHLRVDRRHALLDRFGCSLAPATGTVLVERFEVVLHGPALRATLRQRRLVLGGHGARGATGALCHVVLLEFPHVADRPFTVSARRVDAESPRSHGATKAK